MINILDNNFSTFLDIESYKISEIIGNNFLLNNPDSKNSVYSQYKMKHNLYKIVLPHELLLLNHENYQNFHDKYTRRIARFYELEKSGKQIIFIRLGTFDDMKHLDKLELSLSRCFTNFKLKFINSNLLEKSVDWKRDNNDWRTIINSLI